MEKQVSKRLRKRKLGVSVHLAEISWSERCRVRTVKGHVVVRLPRIYFEITIMYDTNDKGNEICILIWLNLLIFSSLPFFCRYTDQHQKFLWCHLQINYRNIFDVFIKPWWSPIKWAIIDFLLILRGFISFVWKFQMLKMVELIFQMYFLVYLMYIVQSLTF